jgi:hypothetical protein
MGKRAKFIWLGTLILLLAGSLACNTVTRLMGGATATPDSSALDGIRIKIIYIADREADALEAQSRLEAQGADIVMLEVDNSGISRHIGKLYYMEGNEDLAIQVAAEVADLEVVKPTLQTVAPDVGQKLNLWIASPK